LSLHDALPISAKIDIVGGETMFFENIVRQVSNSKGFDHLINNSQHALDIKHSLLGPDGKGDLSEKVRGLADRYGISSNDIKNLTFSTALIKLQQAALLARNAKDTGFIDSLFGLAKNLGISNKTLGL